MTSSESRKQVFSTSLNGIVLAERGIQLSALWPRQARPGVALMLGRAAHSARFPCEAAARHWRASHAAPLQAR